MQDDERDRKATWEGLEFIAKLMVGSGDQPTAEKPVVESVVRNGKMEIATKKVTDFDHEAKVKKMIEQSKAIMDQAGPILEKMRQEMAQKQAGGTNG